VIYALLFLILFAILFPKALRFLFALLFIGGIMALGEVHAKSMTPTSKALNACGKLSGAAYHDCLNKIPKCEAQIVKDINDFWHKGMTFSIDGGSEDPGIICQHGGDCIPLSAVRFKESCLIVNQEGESGPYYHWERAPGK
jgi:hypothetical protein